MSRGVVLGLASAIALAPAAEAADVYAPAGVGLKDVPVYPAYNWTGFYVGTHSGGAIGVAKVADPYGPAIFGDTIRTPGALWGGQIG